MAAYLKAIPWTDEIEKRLRPTVIDEPTYSIANLRAEVLGGSSTLIGGFEGQILEGVMVFFVENFGGESEFVLQAGAGLIGDKAALAKYYPLLETEAKRRNCVAIRTHLARDTYQAVYKGLGFRRSEIVMRRSLI